MANREAVTGSFNGCKRSMVRAVALGLLTAAASAAPGEVAEAGYRWTVRNQEQAAPVTGGVFRAGAQRARLTLDTPLEPNTRLTLAARVSKNGGVRLSTGRRDERLAISVAFGEAPTIQCSYTDPAGNVPMRRTLRIGGVAKPNFGWTDTLLDWLEHYRGLEAAQPLEARWLRLALELRGGRCRFLLDGRLLHEWTPTEDLYGNRPAVEIDPGADVSVPEVRRLAPENPLHLPVDISASFNAAGLSGEALDPASLPARGAEFAVGGIPFMLGEAAKAGCDNLDIGLSWFREGNLTSYEEPHNGSFGGRWAGSASGNPTRFQFPLPQRSVTALHLLAASETKPDAMPRLTAQFYRPTAGSPKNFVSPDVPPATAAATASSASLPVKTASGRTLHLWRVTIPVEPGLLQEFEDLDVLEVELTKDVQIFRAYPDPNHYSFHAAGLPSSVRVFALTLGVAPVAVRFEPEALGNVWVESAPAYRVTARNNTPQPKEVRLDIRTVSHDGSETNQATRTLAILPNGEKTVRFDLPLKRYGHHAVTLLATCDGAVQTHARTLSRLRRRETTARTFDAKGFMFAKGEKWTSVGTVGEWNSDDTPCASAFNFDGWRLLRFELPSHAPYDSFRELGTTWWGSSGGDAVVDLPLAVEKLFIERRPKAMYVNSLEPADPAPVLLGELAVEYASVADRGDDAVERNRVRMPPSPAGSPRVNPIAALAAAGTLPAGAITAVEQPAHYYDGTRGNFSFAAVDGAVHYDIWLARHADGRDALKLGSRLAQSGAQVGGFRAGTDFYAFLVYTDKAGAVSKPSAPFKFRLENQFGMR